MSTIPRSLDIVAGQVATKATANITNNITINDVPVKISPQAQLTSVSSKGSLTREIRNSSCENVTEGTMSPTNGLMQSQNTLVPEVLENKARFIEPNPYEVPRDTLAAHYPSTVSTRDISQFEAKPSYEFLDKYCFHLQNLLKYKNKRAIYNLLDPCDKVIMSQSELIYYIALYGGFQESDITIVLEPIEEVGCFCKRALFTKRTISNIKILQRDFKLFYNNFYNEMVDIRDICLTTIVE